MYIKRAAEETVLRVSKMFGALLITGPRQVGKTTLLNQFAEKGRKYVTLDDPEMRILAKTDPALFIQTFSPPVIIDEIQYAPELLPYIKMSVDTSKKKGEYWLTGSQTFHTMKDVSESLAGRVGIVRLQGLSNCELNSFTSEPFLPKAEHMMERATIAKPMNVTEIYERLWKGSMPAVHTEDVDWKNFYNAYISTYLQRDIKDLTQVADELSFYNFMTVVAARTAKPIVYDEIARDAAISSPTAKKWLSILVSSGIVALVQPYYSNILKRVTKMPLLHFLDTGLCAFLLKWNTAETLEYGAMAGAFFESFVFSEIYKSWLNFGEEPPIFYYRDKDGKEIDLLIQQNGKLHPIEIKKSASPNKSMMKHFKVIAPLSDPEKFGQPSSTTLYTGTGAIVCMIKSPLPADRDNWYIPAWMI